jgi:phytoene dehydrogenase-like protein
MPTVIVVGGGLAALSVSTWLARGGARVRLYERSAALGGRARTHEVSGCRLNLGPHALYRAGGAAEGLRALGVPVHGKVVPIRAGLWRAGEIHPFGDVPWRLLSTPLLPGASAAGLAHFLSRIALGAPEARGRTVEEWLSAWPEPVQALARWLVRISSYAHAPGVQDAERAAAQVRQALRGVLYLDGGWQSLVDGLREAALSAGVELHTGVEVVRATDTSVETDGLHHADAVVLAVPPATARRLGATIPELVPVRAQCLDLVLDGIPTRPAVFGLDVPFYFSAHSAVARLAPPGASVVHAAAYLAPGEEGDLDALEAWVDTVHPGWRGQVRLRRAGTHVVTHALDLRGVPRHGPRSPEGHWLVGDWLGEGMLADAAIHSARSVAAALLAEHRLAA